MFVNFVVNTKFKKNPAGPFYSCNIYMSDFPDIYAQSPRAAGIYITSKSSAHFTATIM